MKFFISLSLAVFAVSVNAQLLSDKAAPLDCKFNFEEKFNADINEYAGKYKNDIKYKEKLGNFFTGSLYELKLLYKSGKLVFNEKLETYVNNVLEKVLKSESGLADKIKIHIIRSSYVNAFTLYTGDVFVTLGLLAQLENEAQLAYILAHETSHYKLGHHVNTVLNAYTTLKKTTGSNTLDKETKELLEYAFSRELEFEADSLGFILTKNSPYASSAAITAMDVLQYSYLPFNEIVFEPAKLYNDSIIFPKSCLLDKIHTINFDSDKEEDNRSTHPNVAKRRKYLKHLALKSGNNAGAVYIVGKKEFNEIREISRKDVCELLLHDGDAVMAVYNSYVVDKEKSDLFSKELLGKATYELAMQKATTTFKSSNDGDNFKEGEIERAWHFFNELSNEQALFTALYINYNLYASNKKIFYRQVCDQLISTILKEHSVTIDDIRSYLQPAKTEITNAIDSSNTDVDTTNQDAGSKYARIRNKKTEVLNAKDTVVIDPGTKFHYLLFKSLLNNPDFVSIYTAGEDAHFKAKSNTESSSEKVTFTNNSHSNANKGNDAVAVSRGLIFSPLFGTHLKSYTDFYKLIEGQNMFPTEIQTYFSKTGVSMDEMSFESMNLQDVEAYNKYCRLMDYVNETFDKEGKYMPLTNEYIDQGSSEKYSHLILTKMSRSKESRSNIGMAIFCGIIAFPLLPAAIYYAATKELKERCYLAIIDLKTHKIIIDRYHTIGDGKYKNATDYYSSFIKK